MGGVGPVVVVGAGVLGLAVARRLAQRGDEVFVLDALDRVGAGVTSRTSEVIHAGLYYPPGSRKARTCVRGRALLYAYAEARDVPHRQTGKLVVATDPSQVEALRALRANARACGAGELPWLHPDDVAALEPALRCVAALWSPRSGIVDSHALTEALALDVEDAGGTLALRTPVASLAGVVGGIEVRTGGDAPHRLRARHVVVAAGHGSLDLARTCVADRHLPPPPTQWAKGTYMALQGCPPPFQRLVYPLPEPGGLGIHATVDLAGQVRFGPDVEWVDSLDVAPSTHRVAHFEAAVRRYWPDLPDGALVPAYAGIRPKVVGPGTPAADFVVLDPASHGVEGLTLLLGIESPGLTAALALADEVVAGLA